MAWKDDVYFDENYGKLYEKIELGSAQNYLFKCEYGTIIHQFIKRKIPMVSKNVDYFDIRTPYGYGGPLIIECCNKEKLVKAFSDDFNEYCKQNHIVTEFVRFHPMAQNALDFIDIYDLEMNRKTVGTNLMIKPDPIKSEFSTKCRKNIRRALNKGVSFRYIEKPKDLHDFQAVYYDTMKRNKANDYYYFDDDYFKKIIEFYSNKLLVIYAEYQQKIIAAGLYIISNNVTHIHLSGTYQQYLELSPAYILRYAVAKWSIEHGISYLHHGGGRTPREDDSLYLFKKQFGVNTKFDFYISEKIWNNGIYKKICELKKSDETVNSFIERMESNE